MFLTPKIEQAIVRATVLHQGQKRKVSGVPYIVHPYGVAFLLAHYTDDEDVIIAGLLHDVLEDVPEYTEVMLRDEFGDRVCQIVKEVTEDYLVGGKGEGLAKDSVSWRQRKAGYIENLKNDSPEALLVATADKIHNMRGLIEEYRTHGESVWEKFRRDSADMLWFYQTASEAIRGRLEHPLVDEMRRVLDEFEMIVIKRV